MDMQQRKNIWYFSFKFQWIKQNWNKSFIYFECFCLNDNVSGPALNVNICLAVSSFSKSLPSRLPIVAQLIPPLLSNCFHNTLILVISNDFAIDSTTHPRHRNVYFNDVCACECVCVREWERERERERERDRQTDREREKERERFLNIYFD